MKYFTKYNRVTKPYIGYIIRNRWWNVIRRIWASPNTVEIQVGKSSACSFSRKPENTPSCDAAEPAGKHRECRGGLQAAVGWHWADFSTHCLAALEARQPSVSAVEGEPAGVKCAVRTFRVFRDWFGGTETHEATRDGCYVSPCLGWTR